MSAVRVLGLVSVMAFFVCVSVWSGPQELRDRALAIHGAAAALPDCDTDGLHGVYCDSKAGQTCQHQVQRCKTGAVTKTLKCRSKDGTALCANAWCVSTNNDTTTDQCTKKVS